MERDAISLKSGKTNCKDDLHEGGIQVNKWDVCFTYDDCGVSFLLLLFQPKFYPLHTGGAKTTSFTPQ